MEDGTSHATTHDLLLALAGRVDDDLLSWTRELVALGEDARAVELLTASLVAARTVLPVSVHAALVVAARSARIDPGPVAALPRPRPEDGTEHRFAEPDGDDPVAGALLTIPARPLAGCTVLLTRRLTPAGAAPGPLPHPVVLVRVHAPTRPPDVLAYQLGAALERAGAPASVEVLAADGPVSAYHAAALNRAVELRDEAQGAPAWRPGPVALAEHDHPIVEHDGTGDRDTRGYPDSETTLDAGPDADRSTGHETDRDGVRSTDDAAGYGREPEPGYDDLEQNESVATTVLRATPSPPEWSSGPAAERHPLAPDPAPERAAGPVGWFDDTPTPEPVQRPRPEPPEHLADRFGSADPDDRRATAAASRHPAEPAASPSPSGERAPLHDAGRPEPDDREFDHAGSAVASTGRIIRPALGSAADPTSDVRSAVTGWLPVDGERVRQRNGARRDEPGPYDAEAAPRNGTVGTWAEDESPVPEDDAAPAAPPSPHPLAAPRPVRDEPGQPPRPAPAPMTAPTPMPALTNRPRPTLTPISRASLPEPIPLVRKDGPKPVPRPVPVTEPRPVVRPVDDDAGDAEPATEERPETRPPETSAMEAVGDPLHDPLHRPLLDPLLDPTPHDDALSLDRGAPAVTTEDAPGQDDEWSEEWLTGAWAMPPSALANGGLDEHRGVDRDTGERRIDHRPAHSADAPGGEDGTEERGDDHRADERIDPEPGSTADAESPEPSAAAPPHPSRHRYLAEPVAADGSRHDRDPDAPDAELAPAVGEESRAEHGPEDPADQRPEPVARLSDADRQLLARLQAELLEGRKPRFGRRNGLTHRPGDTGATTNGSASTNGSHRGTPPDLAG